MSTAAQIAANQANARRSTGPKTAAGKARVAQNAIRHGLTSTYFVIAEDEEPIFDKLDAELRAELNPQGAVENLTFLDLLHAAWNLHRARRMEQTCARADPDDFAGPQFTWLDRIARHQARCQRAWYRALQELRTLQTNRALREAALAKENAEHVPVLADIAKLTKQTQSRPANRTAPPPTPPAGPQLVGPPKPKSEEGANRNVSTTTM
jgi:hypothetical protein